MSKYLKNKWFLLFLIIPFFKPVCFQYYSKLWIVEKIFVNWKIVSALVGIFFLGLYIWNKSQIPKVVIQVALFELTIVGITYYKHGDISRAMIDSVTLVAYTSIWVLAIKYNCHGIIRLLSNLLSTLMMINLFTMIIFPKGIHADLYYNVVNPLYFMVVDNGSVLFLIFCIVIFMLDGIINADCITGKKIILLIGCAVSAVLSRSATTIFCVFFLLLVIVLRYKSDLMEKCKPGIFFVLYVIFFIYLLSMQNGEIAQFVIEKIFHRSGNFSGRYVLWETALIMISRHPWIGYGRMAQDYIAAWGAHYSSHNYILELMLQGGIIATGQFIFLIFVSIKKCLLVPCDKITNCLEFSLLAVLIAVLMESTIHSVWIFGVIILCYNCQYLVAEAEK